MTEFNNPDMAWILQEARRISENESAYGGRGDDYEKFKEGDNYIRILPPWSRTGKFAIMKWTHFNLPFEKKVAPCMKSFPDLGARCSICEVLSALEGTTQQVRQMRSNQTYLVNAIIYDVQGKDLVPRRIRPYILQMPKSVYNQIITLMANSRIGNITDPNNGYILLVQRSPKAPGQFVKYTCTVLPPACSIVADPTKLQEVLSQLHDLDKCVKMPSVEELKLHEMLGPKILANYQQVGMQFQSDAYPSGYGGSPLPSVSPQAAPQSYPQSYPQAPAPQSYPQAPAPQPYPQPVVQAPVDPRYPSVAPQASLAPVVNPAPVSPSPRPVVGGAPQAPVVPQALPSNLQIPGGPTAASTPAVQPQPAVQQPAPEQETDDGNKVPCQYCGQYFTERGMTRHVNVAHADQVSAPAAGNPGPSANPTPQGQPSRPVCYGNHKIGDRKCIACPYELDCSENPLTAPTQ